MQRAWRQAYRLTGKKRWAVWNFTVWSLKKAGRHPTPSSLALRQQSRICGMWSPSMTVRTKCVMPSGRQTIIGRKRSMYLFRPAIRQRTVIWGGFVSSQSCGASMDVHFFRITTTARAAEGGEISGRTACHCFLWILMACARWLSIITAESEWMGRTPQS